MVDAHDVVTSPRLNRLRNDLKGGQHIELETFWKEMADQGTPLIESIMDSDLCLVTFLWRDGGESGNVEVVSNFEGGLGEHDRMNRLPGSDVWYKTFALPKDTRETYQLSINGRDFTDPFNPLKQNFPVDKDSGYGGWESSVFELPEAPAQPWITARPGVPAGQVDKHNFRSQILGNDYPVWIYTPPGYSPEGKDIGFLLVLDGWFYINLMPLPTILDNLLADGRLPGLAAIMVGSLTYADVRKRDYGCYSPYIDFLSQELLPWAREKVHLSEDPGQAAVVGASRGGLMAAYIGMRLPGVFGNVLTQSGSFDWRPAGDSEPEWLARQFAAGQPLPLHFYLEAGLFETKITIVEGYTINLLASNRHLRNILQAKGYRVAYREFSGGHSTVIWRGTLADGLIELFGEPGDWESSQPA